MRKVFTTALAISIAAPAWSAQQPLTEISTKQSRQDMRNAINTQVVAPSQANFTAIWEALNGSPWLAQTTAPNTHNVFWIDTSGTSPAIKYWDGDSWEVAASGGDGTYTIPTASTETKGGVKIGARLTMTGEVLSADVQTTDISGKQDALVSGTNIKTVNGTSVLGSGNLVVGDGGGIAHATSDGNYYASRNGEWASLVGVFAAPLGTDDNYVTDAEKSAIGNLGSYALTSSVLAKTNTTAYTPTADYHPSTKKYVDDSITASGGYTDEQAQDAIGAMFSGNTETGITVTYDDATGKADFVVATQSDVNFTAAKDAKLADIASGAEVNVNADWNASSGDAQILNKPTLPTYGAGVVPALGNAPDTAGGFLLANTYLADPKIAWDAATITETVDAPIAGTNTIGVKAGVFQAYDADWLGITANGASLVSTSYAGMKTLLDTDDIQTLTGIPAGTAHLGTFTGSTIPDSSTIKVGMQALETAVEGKQATISFGTGVSTAVGNNTGAVGGLPTIIASGAYTVDTASISANTCASAVAVTASGVATTDTIITTPNAILSTVAGFGVTTAGAVRVDIYPTSGNVNFQFCNPTGAAIDPGSVSFNWKVLR